MEAMYLFIHITAFTLLVRLFMRALFQTSKDTLHLYPQYSQEMQVLAISELASLEHRERKL